MYLLTKCRRVCKDTHPSINLPSSRRRAYSRSIVNLQINHRRARKDTHPSIVNPPIKPRRAYSPSIVKLPFKRGWARKDTHPSIVKPPIKWKQGYNPSIFQLLIKRRRACNPIIVKLPIKCRRACNSRCKGPITRHLRQTIRPLVGRHITKDIHSNLSITRPTNPDLLCPNSSHCTRFNLSTFMMQIMERY